MWGCVLLDAGQTICKGTTGAASQAGARLWRATVGTHVLGRSGLWSRLRLILPAYGPAPVPLLEACGQWQGLLTWGQLGNWMCSPWRVDLTLRAGLAHHVVGHQVAVEDVPCGGDEATAVTDTCGPCCGGQSPVAEAEAHNPLPSPSPPTTECVCVHLEMALAVGLGGEG